MRPDTVSKQFFEGQVTKYIREMGKFKMLHIKNPFLNENFSQSFSAKQVTRDQLRVSPKKIRISQIVREK